jgi:hypothetical protein
MRFQRIRAIEQGTDGVFALAQPVFTQPNQH